MAFRITYKEGEELVDDKHLFIATLLVGFGILITPLIYDIPSLFGEIMIIIMSIIVFLIAYLLWLKMKRKEEK